jgi:hypothetical protein
MPPTYGYAAPRNTAFSRELGGGKPPVDRLRRSEFQRDVAGCRDPQIDDGPLCLHRLVYNAEFIEIWCGSVHFAKLLRPDHVPATRIDRVGPGPRLTLR